MADTLINTIDIVIPTYRPGEKFLRLFAMLKKQTRPFNKLIIMNTEHELMPKEVRSALNADGRVIIRDITEDEFDHAATRAAGVSISGADAFICMTDDAVPADTELIERLISALESGEKVAVAYARQLAAADADESEKFVRVFNYPDKGRKKSIADLKELGIKTYFASNVCCAYKRSIYDGLGGFIDRAIFNEDMIYACTALKVGYESVYAADARVVHSHNYTAMQQLHRNFDLGMSQRMHPEVFGGLKSEGEGMKLVKSTIAHLAASGHAVDIPVFIVRTAFRYAGYRAGKMYDRLPRWLCLKLAMNKRFIRRNISK
ncbi:MAG: glycosyltransferase [Eubacteriales bacterium]|nr:glycosyltransferase [Eubacteriales bacterium]